MSVVRSERGFTLIELLVATSVFMLVAVAFYQVTFSGVAGSDTAQSVAQVSEEARLGFNRMIRDTREAVELAYADANEYRIWVDFDQDGTVDPGSYEHVGFEYVDSDGDAVRDSIELSAYGADLTSPGIPTEGPVTLMAGVETTTDSGGSSLPVFVYTSNLLQYDVNGNGQVTVAELHSTAPVSHANPHVSANAAELDLISGVSFAFVVDVEGRESEFFAEVQLRNKRFRNE